MEKIDGYIDIPSGYIPNQGFYLNVSGGYEIGQVPQDIDKYNLNASLNFVFPKFEGLLAYYRVQDWTIDLKYLLFSKKVYSLSMGIDRITYRKYITPLGGGDTYTSGYLDEQYRTRPQERFSIYVVNTYKPFDFVELTAGIGRGKYVGYGPRSRYFNIDYFLTKSDTSNYHPDYSFGLFWGLRVKILPFLSGVIEFDGRDVNGGIGFNFGNYYFNLCLTKIEQISDIVDRNVRFNFSFGGKVYGIAQKKTGFIIVRVYDDETKLPLQCVIELTDLKTNKTKSFVVNEQGVAQILTEEGSYKLVFKKENYVQKTGKVKVVKDKKIDIKIGLKRILSPEETLVESKLNEVKELINSGRLNEANNLINECMKIIPGYSKTVALQKELKDLIKIKVDSLNNLASQYEKTNPEIGIRYLEEILKITPNDESVKSRIDALKIMIASKTKPVTPPPQVKPEKPKEIPKTQTQKPSQEEINNWYKEAVNLYLQGKYKESKTLLEKILKYDPTNEKAKKYLEKVKEKI